MDNMFFDGWGGIIKILIAAPLIYVAIIAFIRVSGKRSTSQMNNFDWLVTVALGSLIASGVVLENVTISESLLAIGLLMGFQWILTAAVMRSSTIEAMVKAEPRLLVHDGRYLRGAMRRERVSEEEIQAALRREGLTAVDDARWVILENDATLNVLPRERHERSAGGPVAA